MKVPNALSKNILRDIAICKAVLAGSKIGDICYKYQISEMRVKHIYSTTVRLASGKHIPYFVNRDKEEVAKIIEEYERLVRSDEGKAYIEEAQKKKKFTF